MLSLPNDCILLDGPACVGNLSVSPNRLFCPRSIVPFWREIWLERVEPARDPTPSSASSRPSTTASPIFASASRASSRRLTPTGTTRSSTIAAPDRTREIAEEYAARDPRIRVHNNDEFVSCEANHNIAVRQISPESKYCKIVAADDWLFPECLARMVELADANPTVGIVSSYGLRDRGKAVHPPGFPIPILSCPGVKSAATRSWAAPISLASPPRCLYRADLTRIRHAFFNESHIQADTESCYEFLRDNDFGFIHQILYLHSHAERLHDRVRRRTEHIPSGEDRPSSEVRSRISQPGRSAERSARAYPRNVLFFSRVDLSFDVGDGTSGHFTRSASGRWATPYDTRALSGSSAFIFSISSSIQNALSKPSGDTAPACFTRGGRGEWQKRLSA